MAIGIRSTLAGIVLGFNRNIILKSGDVAAAGSTQANATALTYRNNNVTAADGTKGVVLPAIADAGHMVVVYNSVATNGLKVYPATGGTINGGSANAAVVIEGKTLAIFVASSSGNWGAVFTANT